MPSINIAQLLGSAIQHLRSGRLAEAESLIGQVLAKYPRDFDALHLMGVVAKNKGEFDRAAELIGRAIATQPRLDVPPRTVQEALSAERAKPTLAAAHFNRGNALQAAGRLDEAIESFSASAALNGKDPTTFYNLAIALVAQGRIDEGIENYRKSIAIAPNNAVAHNNLGNALAKTNRLEEAAEAYRQAIAVKPDYGDAYNNLGNALGRLKRFEEAYECFRQAVAIDPNHAEAYNGLGLTLRDLGRFEESQAAIRRSLELDPKAVTFQGLALSGRNVANPEEFERLEALLKRSDLKVDDRIAAEFAMARMLDGVERFDEAFAHLATANRLFKESRAEMGVRFDAGELRQRVDQAIATFTPEFFAERRAWGNPSELPVFIVGMPRSGTTLVEQIAASHPDVFGGGERTEVHNVGARKRDVPNGGTVLDAPMTWEREWIAESSSAIISELHAVGGAAIRVTDKLPGNVFYLGLIGVLFPNARVVFCQRDPRDNCFSCYFEQFDKNNVIFSYDLEDCGRQYNETQRLVRHWLKNLPLKMLELHYETLVGDQEAESRRLIDFLGLPWAESCLEFYKTKRAVHTASTWQVRQPMYSRSVGRWRHYAGHLDRLLRVLDEH